MPNISITISILSISIKVIYNIAMTLRRSNLIRINECIPSLISINESIPNLIRINKRISDLILKITAINFE